LGLLEDDSEWHSCLVEAALSQQPAQLRQLFAVLLLYCQPNSPSQLFDEFLKSMAEDILHIDQQLKSHDSSIRDFPAMPQPTTATYEITSSDEVYDTNELSLRAAQPIPLLNSSQRRVFDIVSDAVNQKTPLHIFVDGPGRTGKTFLYNVLSDYLRSLGIIVLAVATSGIAALLLHDGRTAHSRLKYLLRSTNIQRATFEPSLNWPP
jgi:PIF1-like helicase